MLLANPHSGSVDTSLLFTITIVQLFIFFCTSLFRIFILLYHLTQSQDYQMATTKAPPPPTNITLQSGRSLNTMDCHSNQVISPNNQFSVKKFFKLMRYERLRLITYILYNHKWPKEDVISPSELAKAGFFYIHDDAVQCTFCHGIVRGWEYGMFFKIRVILL